MQSNLSKSDIINTIIKALFKTFPQLTDPYDEKTSLDTIAADSLDIINIISAIEKDINMDVDPSVFYGAKTIDDLAEEILEFIDESY